MSDWRELEQILKKGESECVEYKAAKTDFSYPELKKYCSALSNSGCGDLILGVDDSGTPIGTSAYSKYHEIPNKLLLELGIKVDVVEYTKDNLRVLRFIVPEHEPGKAVKCNGIRYVRVGSSVREMEDADYMKILMETVPDFSGEVQKEFSLNDIDENAILNFKKL
jgi:ATP-dependent DNA helicase RecG